MDSNSIQTYLVVINQFYCNTVEGESIFYRLPSPQYPE
jgi:hypothetical protein